MQSGVAYVCSVAEYTSLIYFLTKYLLLHIWGFKQTWSNQEIYLFEFCKET